MQLLWRVSLAAGLGYFFTIPWHPFPGSIALKGLAVSTLALAAFGSRLETRNKILLGLALALSSLGDVLLDLNPSLFAPGLASFLMAHLCYINLFFGQRRKGDAMGLIRALAALGLAVFAVGFTIWLAPVLNDMALPVMLYIGALSGMVFTALAWRAKRSDWVVYGAFLFLISDAVLAQARFRGPVPLRDWIVWGTYYAAQYLIASGVLRELGAENH